MTAVLLAGPALLLPAVAKAVNASLIQAMCPLRDLDHAQYVP